MLQAFKDEVDTLKEALWIAALDIRDVAKEEFTDKRKKTGEGGDDEIFWIRYERYF